MAGGRKSKGRKRRTQRRHPPTPRKRPRPRRRLRKALPRRTHAQILAAKRRRGTRKRPPQKFVFRLDKVQVITGTELFQRRLHGLKEERKRAFRRMGPLGGRIAKSKVPLHPRMSLRRLPKGTLNRRKIERIKVLVKARINGRVGYFTKGIRIGKKKGRKAKEIAKDFAQNIIETVPITSKHVQIISMVAMFGMVA